MRTIQVTIFETAEEYFDACPLKDAYVVFDGRTMPRFSGNRALEYEFDNVSQSDLVETAFVRLKGKVHLT